MSLVCLDCHAQNNNELGELNHKPGCSYATDSEVPQGNQDGASCPFCNGTASATGIRPQPCHSCGGAGVITAASSGSEPSTASENASGGGSQDSIDRLVQQVMIQSSTLSMRELILAWHNTQLKAAIPEEKKPTEEEFLAYDHGYNQAIIDIKRNLEK